jgi:hypothetical protein
MQEQEYKEWTRSHAAAASFSLSSTTRLAQTSQQLQAARQAARQARPQQASLAGQASRRSQPRADGPTTAAAHTPQPSL